MALLTVTLQLVRPIGADDVPSGANGKVDFIPSTHGKYHGALRAVEKLTSSVTQGVMDPVELTPGSWDVTISPRNGNPWPTMTFTLTEDMEEPVNLADLLPDIVVNDTGYAKGDSAYQVAVNEGFVGTEEEWLNSLVRNAIWSKDDQARAQGYWLQVSTDPPEVPYYTLGDGSTVPIVWQKPSDQFIPVIPDEPIWNLSDTSILVQDHVGMEYVISSAVADGETLESGEILPPGEVIDLNPPAYPYILTVSAIPSPGYKLPNPFSWTCHYPDPQAVSVATSDSFAAEPGATIGARVTDLYEGGSPKIWESLGDTTRFNLTGGALELQAGQQSGWGVVWLDVGAVNTRVEFDLSPPPVGSSSAGKQIMSVTLGRYDNFNGYTFYFYETGIRGRSSAASEYTTISSSPVITGRYTIQSVGNTLTVTAPNNPETSVVVDEVDEVGPYIGFRPTDITAASYPNFKFSIDNLVVSQIGF